MICARHCFDRFYHFRISRLNQWTIVGYCESCKQWFVLRNVETRAAMRKLDQIEQDYLEKMISENNCDHANPITSSALAHA